MNFDKNFETGNLFINKKFKKKIKTDGQPEVKKKKVNKGFTYYM